MIGYLLQAVEDFVNGILALVVSFLGALGIPANIAPVDIDR